MSSSVGWLVLAGVFVAELAALVALFVWGLATQGWLLGLAAAGLAAVAWGLFAAPKARYPHPVGRALVKVAVFGGSVAGLWAAGLVGWAVALACFVVAVHALSLLPSVHSVDPREY
jgi:Protein of unknown function (DUF2568)